MLNANSVVCSHAVYDKASLEGDGEWRTVTDENKSQMRFFKVAVEMP